MGNRGYVAAAAPSMLRWSTGAMSARCTTESSEVSDRTHLSSFTTQDTSLYTVDSHLGMHLCLTADPPVDSCKLLSAGCYKSNQHRAF